MLHNQAKTVSMSYDCLSFRYLSLTQVETRKGYYEPLWNIISHYYKFLIWEIVKWGLQICLIAISGHYNAVPQLLLDCQRGRFLNHDIRYTGLLDALSTKQKQLVYKIGGPNSFNCCSDTGPILTHTLKYTEIVQSFKVCAVRQFWYNNGKNFWWKKFFVDEAYS